VVRTHSTHVRMTHTKCLVAELAHTTVGPAAVVPGGCWNVPVLFCGCLQPEDVRGIIA
jgi:hypothetical protein